MHIGSGPGVVGLSGMQVQPLLPLRNSVTLPSAPTVMTDALCAIDAGAADSALLIGSEEVASLVLDSVAAWLFAAGADAVFWQPASTRPPPASRTQTCVSFISPSCFAPRKDGRRSTIWLRRPK